MQTVNRADENFKNGKDVPNTTNETIDENCDVRLYH